MEKVEKEWAKFRVGALGRGNNWTASCKPLDQISHVSHIHTALQIFAAGKINAGLVFDESLLNKRRIQVVWLSPNDWAYGSRYGNVRLYFDWKKLVEGMNYYWIESIAYNIPACRILVTEKDYCQRFPVYDPTKGDGPWWHRKSDDAHFWNGNFCLEIMLERDISLAEIQSFDFVTHHKKILCDRPESMSGP
jgi:hypothetical protein